MIEPYVYPPMDLEEMDAWQNEHFARIACRDGIEEILSSGYDGAHLEPGCARKAIEEFGIQRVELVLAGTVQEHSRDGRFSRQTKEWASCRTISPEDRCRDYLLTAYPAVVDGFVRQYLKTVEEMAREAIAEEGQTQTFPEMML